MDWDDIRYFLALARSGSLSSAARTLGVTHVTVSRRISRLEDGRQVRLFSRRQNRYRLSAAGECLMAEAEAVEKACLSFERQMLGHSDVPEGPLTLSIPENTLIDLSGPLAAFMRAYPGINLTVLATSEQLNLNQLQAEVVIRITDNPPELLVGRRIAEVPLYAYGTREYLASINGDIQSASWAIWQPGTGDMENYFLNMLPGAHITMRTNSNSHLLAMVREGGVLGLISEPIARRHPELTTAVKTPLVTPGLWLLTHSDLREAARVRCFMQFMGKLNWGADTHKHSLASPS